MLVWANADECPYCSRALYTARARHRPHGVLGKAIALIQNRPETRPGRPIT
jgi:hypothetical protein